MTEKSCVWVISTSNSFLKITVKLNKIQNDHVENISDSVTQVHYLAQINVASVLDTIYQTLA